MKGYLVDTNIPSEFTRQQPDLRVADFIRKAGRANLFLSVMTIGEICKGIDLLPASQKRTGLQAWLDIDVRSWFTGRIPQSLGRCMKVYLIFTVTVFEVWPSTLRTTFDSPLPRRPRTRLTLI